MLQNSTHTHTHITFSFFARKSFIFITIFCPAKKRFFLFDGVSSDM